MSFFNTLSEMLVLLFAMALGFAANRLGILGGETDRKISRLHGELPHVGQGKQGAAGGVGQEAAPLLQAAKNQAPEQRLLHKGGQEHHDQQGHVGGASRPGGDDRVVQIPGAVHEYAPQPGRQLAEAVIGHNAHPRRLEGPGGLGNRSPWAPWRRGRCWTPCAAASRTR